MLLSWNVVVRISLGLPYNAHTWILGVLMCQNDMRTQLYVRNIRLIWNAHKSNKTIGMCMNNALYILIVVLVISLLFIVINTIWIWIEILITVSDIYLLVI